MTHDGLVMVEVHLNAICNNAGIYPEEITKCYNLIFLWWSNIFQYMESADIIYKKLNEKFIDAIKTGANDACRYISENGENDNSDLLICELNLLCRIIKSFHHEIDAYEGCNGCNNCDICDDYNMRLDNSLNRMACRSMWYFKGISRLLPMEKRIENIKLICNSIVSGAHEAINCNMT